MKKLVLAVAAVLPLLGSVDTGAAQKLQAGTWTGTVTPPNSNTQQVTYNVAMKADTLTIALSTGQRSFPFSDVKLKDRTLTFWFAPGPRVDCTLQRRADGAYEGPCRDEEGGDARMLLVPPKKN